MSAPDDAVGDPLSRFEYRRAGPVRLYLGDARDVLAAMPDESVDAVVSSPPSWQLRDYGTGQWHGGDPECVHHTPNPPAPGTSCPGCRAVWTDPQYGLEPTVDDYVDRLAAVFEQVWRGLKPTGTVWLNLGDSYATGRRRTRTPAGAGADGMAAKNLDGVPWRVAFALQRSGWWLRNAIIWSKPNRMPESVTDRLTASYELLFQLTRSARYYFDLDPIRVPLARPDARTAPEPSAAPAKAPPAGSARPYAGAAAAATAANTTTTTRRLRKRPAAT